MIVFIYLLYLQYCNYFSEQNHHPKVIVIAFGKYNGFMSRVFIN